MKFELQFYPNTNPKGFRVLYLFESNYRFMKVCFTSLFMLISISSSLSAQSQWQSKGNSEAQVDQTTPASTLLAVMIGAKNNDLAGLDQLCHSGLDYYISSELMGLFMMGPELRFLTPKYICEVLDGEYEEEDLENFTRLYANSRIGTEVILDSTATITLKLQAGQGEFKEFPMEISFAKLEDKWYFGSPMMESQLLPDEEIDQSSPLSTVESLMKVAQVNDLSKIGKLIFQPTEEEVENRSKKLASIVEMDGAEIRLFSLESKDENGVPKAEMITYLDQYVDIYQAHQTHFHLTDLIKEIQFSEILYDEIVEAENVAMVPTLRSSINPVFDLEMQYRKQYFLVKREDQWFIDYTTEELLE